jgi:hypothetical protein
MNAKVCSKCGVEKDRSGFSADKGKPDGLYAHCKTCAKGAHKAYREANHAQVLAQEKARYEANRAKMLERHKAYREANRGRVLARTKARYEANQDKERARMKARYEANRDKILAQKKAYHAEYCAKHGVAPSTALRRRAPQARLADILRSRLRDALKGKFKTGSAVQDLGMPIDDFLMYLNLGALDKYGIPYTGNESKFHIDHIRPLSSFDLEDPEQLRIAVRWDNLQVLRAEENLRKGAKCPSQLTQS